MSSEERRAAAVLLRRGHPLSFDQRDAAQVVIDHAARQRRFALFFAVLGLAMVVLFAIGQPRRLSELVFGGLYPLVSAALGWDAWRRLSAAARQGITRTRRA